MPTVLRIKGYAFRYYSLDLQERPPVHLVKSGRETKLWLDTLTFHWNGGYSEKELTEIRRIARQHLESLIKPWKR